MAVFVVLAEHPNKQLGQKVIEAFPNDHYVLDDRSWLVSANVISRKVSDLLEITSDEDILAGKMGRAIVFAIDGYYGFHDKDIWEWINLKI